MEKINIKSDSPCKRFSHIGIDGNPIFVDKIKYRKKAEAQLYADRLNQKENAIYQSVPYLCPVCHYWHVGKSPVKITHYANQNLKNI